MRMRRAVGIGAVTAAVVATALAGSAGAASAATTAGSKTNTMGVRVVRFAPGTSAAAMRSAITAAGGEVVTDLSKQNRMTAYAPSASFDSAITKHGAVQAVWLDRVIPLSRVDVAPAGGAAGPQLGSPGTNTIPDPWHDLDSFWGENAPGVLQWDDDANRARGAWPTTIGDRTVKVAVLDTGVDFSHKEIAANADRQNFANTIPCNLLTRQFGQALGQRDCSMTDTEGHGTWVAGRIAGAVNGFASNGVAPGVSVMGYKVLSTTLGGGLTSWIVDGMVRACDADADVINMSLGGWNTIGADDEDTLLWVDAVNYCRAKGTAIIASAGNDHVRINRMNLTIGGRTLNGIGQADTGPDGVASVAPGSTALGAADLRGKVETPAGIPGVIMVSASNNTNGSYAGVTLGGSSKPTQGLAEQLTYYSNYGSRIDIGAPGGARKFNVPRWDGGPGDVLYGGWGELGPLTAGGEICTDPSLSSPLTFACFKVQGAAFGWLQGTSMSAPNATGVAALTLAAHHDLQGNPDGLLNKLQSTARTGMKNATGPNNANDTSTSYAGVACQTGYCHVDFANPISDADAYGAGMVDAAKAVT